MKSSIIVALVTLTTCVLLSFVTHPTKPEEQTTVTVEEVQDTLTPPAPLASPQAKAVAPKIRHLDLTKEDITLLVGKVTDSSVDTVINDINKFNTTNTTNKTKPIYLLLDSPGGSVMSGQRLITTIEGSVRPIYALDMGMAASMGFMILEHSHKRLAVNRAMLMAHGASIGVMYQGKLDELVSRYSFLKRGVDKLDRAVAKRAGMTYEAFKARSSQELWDDAADALSDHLLDEIVSVTLPALSGITSSNNKLKQDLQAY